MFPRLVSLAFSRATLTCSGSGNLFQPPLIERQGRTYTSHQSVVQTNIFFNNNIMSKFNHLNCCPTVISMKDFNYLQVIPYFLFTLLPCSIDILCYSWTGHSSVDILSFLETQNKILCWKLLKVVIQYVIVDCVLISVCLLDMEKVDFTHYEQVKGQAAGDLRGKGEHI